MHGNQGKIKRKTKENKSYNILNYYLDFIPDLFVKMALVLGNKHTGSSRAEEAEWNTRLLEGYRQGKRSRSI